MFKPESNQPDTTEPEPGVYLQNVVLVGNQQGYRTWELVAKNVHQEGDYLYFDELEQLVLLEEQQPKYIIKAANGIWFPKQARLQLNDNVSVSDRHGFHLTTNQLIWYADAEQFEFMGSTSVTINQGGEGNELQ